MSDTLFLIPARGGSKGVPGKNIKLLNGVPLIHISIDLARAFSDDSHICVSTDSEEIKHVVEEAGLKVPFTRPLALASDNAGMHEVLLHALEYYSSRGMHYKKLVLLQPTSPFRKKKHVQEALDLYRPSLDMVVSVKETVSNPYFKLMKETEEGYLKKFAEATFSTRQSAPVVYELNGAVYVINTDALRRSPMNEFSKVQKYVMDEASSYDIDTMLDWQICELLAKNGFV
ncbi:acylneuraminate cytidylyltransferase family protein [Cytophagaceae bacterium ABcell3]|nr:acylneuraminate cytidylyltransferase family protein [Cytophagaceae bacterium ABcell3]